MDNSRFKFRAWDEPNETMWYSSAHKDGLSEFFNYLGRETLMQFTGLLDKNGKEIYEGDVVKVFMPSNIHNFTVEFHDSAFLLKKLTTGRMWLVNVEYPMEVLGNIYEHSHLLSPDSCHD